MADPDFKLLAEMIAEGKCYELGHSLWQGMPNHPIHPPFMFSPMHQHGDLHTACFSSANDIFVMGGHTGTHVDAIGHVSENMRIHGGHDARSVQNRRTGLTKGDVAGLPPLAGRGVLLDVAKQKGLSFLERGYAITLADMESTCREQEIQVASGDIVLVRTGWAMHYSDADEYVGLHHGVPGVGREAAKWLAEKKVTAVGADTGVFEVRMVGDLPVHRLLLTEHGIPIMENLLLEELARDSVYTFAFIALPLRILGGTGSPIRPVAIT